MVDVARVNLVCQAASKKLKISRLPNPPKIPIFVPET